MGLVVLCKKVGQNPLVFAHEAVEFLGELILEFSIVYVFRKQDKAMQSMYEKDFSSSPSAWEAI